jgi:hypothetical protein
VANVAPIKQGQTETLLLNVVVKLDPQGNITWQQIRRQQAIASATVPGTASANRNAASETAPAATNEAKPATEAAATSAPAAGQTAEDFLDQPGALDDF